MGINDTTEIWVEPTVFVSISVVNDTLCNNDNVILSFSSVNTPTFGIRFDIEVINLYPADISGYTTGNYFQLSDIIDEPLNNSGDTARMIKYIVIPYTINPSGVESCEGINDTIEVWINPTPRAIPINILPEICYTDFTDIELTTPTVMTHGIIEFDYTVAVSSGIYVTGNTTSANDLQVGEHITFDYTNDDDTIQSVFYYITPKNVVTGCANGIIQTVEVKLHPIPIRRLIVTNPLTCGGGSDLALRGILARGVEPFDTIYWLTPYHYNDIGGTADYIGGIGGTYTLHVEDNLGCSADSSITRTKDPPTGHFIARAKLPYFYNTECHDSEDGELEVGIQSPEAFPFNYTVIKNGLDTIQQGVLTKTYNPVDPASFDVISNLGSGEYTVIYIDINGCETIIMTWIYAPPPISADLEPLVYPGGFNTSCLGYPDGEIYIENVTGGSAYSSGDYTYFWSTGDGVINGDNTLDHLTGIPAGTYTVNIFDHWGCVFTDSVTLVDPDGITLTESIISSYADGSNISCNGFNDASIELTFEGGSGTYEYLWTYPDATTNTNEDIYSLYAGDYMLQVTDVNNNGCNRIFNFEITEPDTLNIAINATETFDGLYNISCEGGTADIEITPEGGALFGYTFEWTTVDGSGLVENGEDQTGLTAATYYVSMTDGNGCNYKDTISLTEPQALHTEIETSDITCASPGLNNGSIDLTVSGGAENYPYNFSWSESSTTEDISGLTEGRYYVTVTDAYGCIIQDSADIFLPPPLEISKDVFEMNGYNITCFDKRDGSIDIQVTSGEGPYTFTWTGPDGFNSDQPTIEGLDAGRYIVHIVDQNLCDVEDTTDLVQPMRLALQATLSRSDLGEYNINCFGDSTGTIEMEGINAVGNLRYFWTDGNQSDYRENLPAGQYAVLAVDNNNCNRDTLITLIEPEPISVIASIEQPYCIDMPDGEVTLAASGGTVMGDYFYQWSDNYTGRILSDVPAGTYIYTVTDDNGCTITDTIIVTSEKENCLTIPNAISPNGDNINDVWNIDLIDLYPDAEVKIFNRWGESVWTSEKGYPQPWNGTSRGRKLPIDSYHYIIDLNNGRRPILGHITILR